MDPEEYITLMDVLRGIPDPRKAQGKRYPWLFLLGLIGAALTSGQHAAHANAHWVHLHGTELQDVRSRREPPCPASRRYGASCAASTLRSWSNAWPTMPSTWRGQVQNLL